MYSLQNTVPAILHEVYIFKEQKIIFPDCDNSYKIIRLYLILGREKTLPFWLKTQDIFQFSCN